MSLSYPLVVVDDLGYMYVYMTGSFSANRHASTVVIQYSKGAILPLYAFILFLAQCSAAHFVTFMQLHETARRLLAVSRGTAKKGPQPAVNTSQPN